MKSVFTALCAAIFINASAWMIPAEAGPEVFTANAKIASLNRDTGGLDFENPLSIEFLDWGAVGATGNLAWAVFEATPMYYSSSTSTEESRPAAVPEPASMFLLGTGLLAVAGIGRKKLLNKKRSNGPGREPAGWEAEGYEA